MIALGYTMIIKIKQINNLKNKIEMYKIEEIEHNKKLIEASKKEEELNDLRETIKDKVKKYDEVNQWNQQINQYLN